MTTGSSQQLRQPSEAVRRVVQVSDRARALVEGLKPGTVRLGAGDPDFETPPHIRRALVEAIEAGYSHYAPFGGYPDLRAAIADELTALGAGRWAPEDVVVTNGGSGAIFSAISGMLSPGDQILLPQPTFPSYTNQARFVGAEPVYVPLAKDFHLDIGAIDRAIGPRTRMIALCNPCNPTGVVFEEGELRALADVVVKHNLLVLADEAYWKLVHDGRPFVSMLQIEGLRERALYCQTFSKTYAMTGWRIGYLAALNGMAQHCLVVNQLTGQVTAAVQRAALVALTAPSDWTERMRQEYQARRQLMTELVADTPGLSWRPPDAAFYAFLKFEAPVTSAEMVTHLRDNGVLVNSGANFGPSGEGYIRLSFSVDRASIVEGMRRIKTAVAQIAVPAR
ncbi:MAG: pyridoxal phosphate-dependent aminotransferase [Chloroflexi bacterium]|nr:pyridoxal phosphate-dependent aminotransferase [Chloroflexota bacterium]